MAANTIPASVAKTRFLVTLTSGTSYTVPAGVTYLNVTLQGGGAGAYSSTSTNVSQNASAGQMISSTLAVTPGASIAYAIGAGGTAGNGGTQAGAGGTTTFTGATSAVGGGNATAGTAGTSAAGFPNGGRQNANTMAAGNAGGAGRIDVEYWA
jgi:hypothetical protein